jgi:hypothetical protein
MGFYLEGSAICYFSTFLGGDSEIFEDFYFASWASAVEA